MYLNKIIIASQAFHTTFRAYMSCGTPHDPEGRSDRQGAKIYALLCAGAQKKL